MFIFWFDLDEVKMEPYLEQKIIKEQTGADITEFLGSGAFGETWLCVFNKDKFALKIIYNPSFSKGRIAKEIEGLERVNNEYIVKFYGHGQLNYKRKTLPFLKFEFIDGGNLRQHIINNNWPNYSQIHQLLEGILKGLLHLNEAGIIHRDLKPENILLRNGNYDKPVIVDFGLIKLVDTSDYTIYPRIMGTRPYMAPEQIMGEKPRKNTDLWAIGIILYILITHRHPFYGNYDERLDLESALDRICSGPPQLPKSTPEIINELTMRFLSPEPFKRGSVQRALRDLKGGF